MSSTAAAPLMKTLKFVLFTILLVSAAGICAHFTIPHLEARSKSAKELEKVNAENADLSKKAEKYRKDRTEFQNNNLDFIILTARRNDLHAANEKVFEFNETAKRRK